MRPRLRTAAIVPLAALGAACNFTSGTTPNACTDNVPSACGDIAHCVLDQNQYLQGQFPSSQSFVLRTSSPETVTFSFYFTDRVSAGTALTLTSTEPNCDEQSTYMSEGDLFQLAGSSGVLSFPITMMLTGDHLVQFTCDAYCSYELRYQ
jgi:hypothetical protein